MGLSMKSKVIICNVVSTHQNMDHIDPFKKVQPKPRFITIITKYSDSQMYSTGIERNLASL